ncbi:hypothetical protein Tco_0485479 [Tanacetum coccineum]
MSSSTVTYTSVYTDSESGRVFWGADEELSDGGPEHPPSPDYVPGPKHQPSLVEVPYVPELEYPKYLVPSDVEAPLEDQPLPLDASPTTLSPGYVADSDSDEDPEEDPEEDLTILLMEGMDEEPSEDENDDEEDEEHLAPTVSSVIVVVDHVPSAGDTEAFETDESAPTPRSPHTRVPFSQTRLPASPPLLLPSTSHRTDILEADMSPRKRACFTTLAPGLEVGESLTAGVARQPGPTLEADTWDKIVKAMMEVAPSTLEGVNQRVTELATTVRQDIEEDRPYHRHTAMILDREAMYARMAWTGSEDRSAAIEAHVRTLEAQVATLIAQTSLLQTQLTIALRRIETLEARDPEPQDEPAEAGISC